MQCYATRNAMKSKPEKQCQRNPTSHPAMTLCSLSLSVNNWLEHGDSKTLDTSRALGTHRTLNTHQEEGNVCWCTHLLYGGCLILHTYAMPPHLHTYAMLPHLHMPCYMSFDVLDVFPFSPSCWHNTCTCHVPAFCLMYIACLPCLDVSFPFPHLPCLGKLETCLLPPPT